MEGMKKINTARSPRTPKGNSSPTFEQLLQGDSSKWPSSCPVTPAKEHEQEDHFGHQNNKKSVLSKVKERAVKLKHTLTKKKHGHDDTGSPSSSSVATEDEKDDDNAPEFLGAPMYESEQAPEACKETIRQQPREVPIVSEKHILTSSIAAENENQHKGNEIENKNENENQKANEFENKYKNENAQISQNYGMVTETESGSDLSANYGMHNLEMGGQQIWDKGVSVKEYLMQKLEPGENERALSQMITEAISPRHINHGKREIGVVEMVKEAVTSLLRNEEEQTPTQTTTITSSYPPIPVSTHPQQETEEENHGKILQAN